MVNLKICNIPITIENSRIMICGNPEMVSDTRHMLSDRGLTVSKEEIRVIWQLKIIGNIKCFT